MNTARRVLNKASWPLLDRAVRLIVGLAVTIIVARYLGPEPLGLLSFALAWASFFGGLAWLGLGEAVTRDVVRAPGTRDALLGQVVVLRIAGSLAAVVLAMALLPVFYPGESRAVWWLVLIIVSGTVFTEVGGAAAIWFVASSQTQFIAISRTIPYLLGQAMRLLLVAAGASLVWFAVATTVEALAIFLLGWLCYRYASRSLPVLGWDTARARSLLREALPVMLAAFVSSLALRLDQMMLARLADFREVGIYAAAARLSEVWWTVPLVLTQVAAPMLLFANDDAASRSRHLTAMYGSLLTAALAIAALISIFAVPIVHVALGPQFEGAAPVLLIHAWTSIFIFLDAPTYQELIRQGRQSILLYRALGAVAANFALNLVLIPAYGAVGAAVATVIAFAVSTLVVSAFFAEGRALLRLQAAGVPWAVDRGQAALGHGWLQISRALSRLRKRRSETT